MQDQIDQVSQYIHSSCGGLFFRACGDKMEKSSVGPAGRTGKSGGVCHSYRRSECPFSFYHTDYSTCRKQPQQELARDLDSRRRSVQKANQAVKIA